ncbi:MAG: hypothetical protein PW789_17230 [Edaphobacter sp.]|uniref:hypothetical protein n=1 Tax=Edaphobacter sp. TaxID=1934404 RepID=UPI00238D4BB2|nr:hypothetical protein [Edaphobacter sp.]MDE1178320.1 hypothetical protein [Edaphobacter sp.]
MAAAAPFAQAAAAPSPCADVPHSDHPKASISNGVLDALVFLPDPNSGYYRSSRFDWSGIVGCVSLNGHRFFGEWFRNYDPMTNDAVTGPVEEFRSEEGALGYNIAKPGELFVKPGVGVLRKVDDSPYRFGYVYPLVDSGKWTVKTSKHAVIFTQRLTSPLGYAYIYQKKLTLSGDTMTLEHSLKNTGSKAITTDVYDHDFFIFDGQPTSPGMTIRFSFKPLPEEPLGDAVSLEGNDIMYKEELKPRQTVAGYIKGYSASPSDYHFTVEDTKNKVGIEQSSDSPISRFYLWSIRTTISPEAYIHLDVPPGKTGHWKIHYRFFAPPKNQ